MSEAFDPYRKWLGIPLQDQPPNHYRLLGIAPFEDDLDVIENAASRQITHVRTFQSGRHSAVSQRILNELSTAKLCLMQSDRKVAYDQFLHAQLQAAGRLTAGPPIMDYSEEPAAGFPPPPDFLGSAGHWQATGQGMGPEVRPASLPARGLATSRHRPATMLGRPRRKSYLLPIFLLLASLGILVGGGAFLWNQLREEPAAVKHVSKPKATASDKSAAGGKSSHAEGKHPAKHDKKQDEPHANERMTP